MESSEGNKTQKPLQRKRSICLLEDTSDTEPTEKKSKQNQGVMETVASPVTSTSSIDMLDQSSKESSPIDRLSPMDQKVEGSEKTTGSPSTTTSDVISIGPSKMLTPSGSAISRMMYWDTYTPQTSGTTRQKPTRLAFMEARRLLTYTTSSSDASESRTSWDEDEDEDV